jgi:cytochrome c556
VSEYESLRDALMRGNELQTAHNEAVHRYADENNRQHAEIWQDMAELRDELHAVANRVETLTRAVIADPAEVAQAIVNDANRSTLREVYRDSRDES